MALPKIAVPKYTLTIPSTGETIEFRPYLVKEEKVLMIAMESGDRKQMITALRDVITGCTEGKVNIEKYALFDLEYIFLKLRGKSTGEVSEIALKCESCEAKNPFTLNLDQIEVKGGEKKKNNKVQLTDTVGVLLKYPTVKAVQRQLSSTKGDNQAEMMTVMMASSIESIYDAENVYPTSDETQKEVIEFVESLTADQFRKIAEYFQDMPRLEHDVKFDCVKCKHTNEYTLEGLQSFF